MDTRVESSDSPVLVGYRNHLLSKRLMTSQVVLCLLLQMLSGDDFGRKRVKVATACAVRVWYSDVQSARLITPKTTTERGCVTGTLLAFRDDFAKTVNLCLLQNAPGTPRGKYRVNFCKK